MRDVPIDSHVLAFLESFRNIDDNFRPVPFWSINDRLDASRLCHQVTLMQQAGFGGCFFHVRAGLVDQYLGDAYRDAFTRVLDFASKRNFTIWLYDEDRFPSGVAGGLVTEGHPEFAALQLRFDVQEDAVPGPSPERLCTYNDPGGQHLVCTVVPASPMPRLGGLPYIDVGNPEAVKAFIASTHSWYADTCYESFGSAIPGMFTDEPSYFIDKRTPGPLQPGGADTQPRAADTQPHTADTSCIAAPGPDAGTPCPSSLVASVSGSILPYTHALDTELLEQDGIDLHACAHALVLPVPDHRRIRIAYWKALTVRFASVFCKSVSTWCSSHRLLSTGHFWEHVFPDPRRSGAVMPLYAHLDIPGIDILFNVPPDDERCQVGKDLLVKEVSSVARQLGKTRVLCEVHGASGWDLDFASQKRTVDWLCILGVDFLCHHLVHYSLRGYRKRDFPPSFSACQPWWPVYRRFVDYQARFSWFVSQGTSITDVLVMHPSFSIWADFDGSLASVVGYKQALESLCTQLRLSMVPYDLGDELILSEHGSVQADRLVVGMCSYSVVVFASCTTMARWTCTLLRAFVEAGGSVVFVDSVPLDVEGVEGVEDPLLAKLVASSVYCRHSELDRVLRSANVHRFPVHVMGDGDLSSVYVREAMVQAGRTWSIARCVDGGPEVLQLAVDLGSDDSTTARVRRLEASTGRWSQVAIVDNAVECLLAPGDSVLLFASADGGDNLCSDAGFATESAVHCHLALGPQDALVESPQTSVLVVKQCRWSVDGGLQSPWMEYLEADRQISALARHAVKDVMAEQPYRLAPGAAVSVVVEYRLVIGQGVDRTDSWHVVVELAQTDDTQVLVNGKPARRNGCWHIDPCMSRWDVSGLLYPGDNSLSVVLPAYSQDSMIEAVYLLGDFSLAPCAAYPGQWIVLPPVSLVPGDVTVQGQPYFTGSVQYRYRFASPQGSESSVLRMQVGRFAGAVLALEVDGVSAGLVFSSGGSIEVDRSIPVGMVHCLVVTVYGTLQNAFGCHGRLAMPGFAAPESFGAPDGDVRFAPVGFDGNLELQWINKTSASRGGI